MVSKTDNITSVPELRIDSGLSSAQIAVSVESYINEMASQQAMPAPSNDLLYFFELLQNAIKSKEVSEDIPEDRRLLVVATDPPEKIDTEAITFYLRARTPGQWNRGAAGEARIKEVVPHVRSVVQHPEHQGEKLVTCGKFYDNYVTLNVYAKDDYIALSRVMWLENVMDSFRWYFRVHRISRVIEQGVGDKEKVEIGGLTLTKYPMSYFVRTEDTFQFGSQELKHVELNTYVSTTLEED